MPDNPDFPIEFDDDGSPFVMLGAYKFRIDLEELTGTWAERAKNELRDTPENYEKGLEELKKLIENETDLYLPTDDDSFLLRFLRPCKFYPDSAFRVLKRYYNFKLKHPQYCDNITPQNIRHVFDNEVFVFLPTRSPCGARIKIVNVGTKWNPKTIPLEHLFKAVMVSVEIAMREPKSQVGGAEVILNMQGLSLTHVYQFSPSLAKMMADWVQTCTPIRLKGIHVINEPYIFKVLFAMFKPFLGEKLRKRIFFHGHNKKSLHEKITPDCLPPYLGGTAQIPEYPGSVFSEMLYYYEEDFIKFATYGYKKPVDENSELANGELVVANK